MIPCVLAIDPGPTESAYVWWDGQRVVDANILPNEGLRSMLRAMSLPFAMQCAIEMIACYGMPVGKETFDTTRWVGRFEECWLRRSESPALLVYRADIKLHHCRSHRAKDANVRQALIDKYGVPGTKKQRGVTYGIKSHLWSALAVATYLTETQKEGVAA
jgi:hypothetical protein